MSTKKYPVWLRLVAAGTAIVIFVLVVELALRLAGVEPYFQNRFFTLNRALDYPDVFLRDRTLFWRFQPDRTVTSKYFEGKTYRINTLGLRGDDIPLYKTKKRIITLGNSCTFGWGIPDDSIYPAGLEQNLNGRYEVINGGIPGYTSYQGRRFFESDLVRLKPDIVTLMFSWNDHWAAASQIAARTAGSRPGAGASSRIFWRRRCSEHSRSPRWTIFPRRSPKTWTSTCLGSARYFSR